MEENAGRNLVARTKVQELRCERDTEQNKSIDLHHGRKVIVALGHEDRTDVDHES
jgi:hypothetical protein